MYKAVYEYASVITQSIIGWMRLHMGVSKLLAELKVYSAIHNLVHMVQWLHKVWQYNNITDFKHRRQSYYWEWQINNYHLWDHLRYMGLIYLTQCTCTRIYAGMNEVSWSRVMALGMKWKQLVKNCRIYRMYGRRWDWEEKQEGWHRDGTSAGEWVSIHRWKSRNLFIHRDSWFNYNQEVNSASGNNGLESLLVPNGLLIINCFSSK